MAVLPMLKVRIYGIKKDRKKILEALQRRGAVDVFSEEFKDKDAVKLDTASYEASFLKAKGMFEEALMILEKHSPEAKSMFESLNGKKELELSDYDKNIERIDEITKNAKKVISLSKEISDLRVESARLLSQAEGLRPWADLDIPLNFGGTKRTAVFIGTFPDERDFEKINSDYENALLKEGLKKEDFPIEVQVIARDTFETYAVIFSKKENEKKTEDVLRSIGFSRPQTSFDKVPKELIEKSLKDMDEAHLKVKEAEATLSSMAVYREDFKFMVDYYQIRIDKYKILKKVSNTQKVFVLSGYIPEKDAHRIEEEFTKDFDGAVELSIPKEDEIPPILLKNNGFAAPCEGIIETYSMPAKGEVDPTFVMSIFYYILFGLMLSDLAYGLIMVFACAFCLIKFKGMEEGLKKSLKMFLYCGISTAFWGAMFGSFFGDAVQIISGIYFKKEIVFRPLWFEPVKDPMKMLVFSFSLGIIHLFTGLGMKVYQCIKDKRYMDAVYDAVSWYLLVGGAICYLLSLDMFLDMTQISFKMPPLGVKLSIAAMAAGAILIVLTAGRSSKSPFKRIAKGMYELYGVTSYLSDILSYSRLLALGLATGVISQVFNKMGSMLGSGGIGFILFMVVFLVGHTMNIAINLLGAYVHTNRLQFVEFFGKFYEGGGEKFTPFNQKTKYYKVIDKK